MRAHVEALTKLRQAKAEERGQLIQSIFNMIPQTPVQPFVLRDTLSKVWLECYAEPLDKKQSWAVIKAASRRGMVGRTDDGMIYPRHG